MKNTLLFVLFFSLLLPLKAQQAEAEKIRNNEIGLMATDIFNGSYLLTY